ncbi:MAG: hypothetical protein QM537_00190 [Candidatus Symbiobacter sp.]|nr:hypothetical protein [Candidatus Symbiobacter sp.]
MSDLSPPPSPHPSSQPNPARAIKSSRRGWRQNLGFGLTVLFILAAGIGITAWQRPDLVAKLLAAWRVPWLAGQSVGDNDGAEPATENAALLPQPKPNEKPSEKPNEKSLLARIEELQARVTVLEKALAMVSTAKGDTASEATQQLATRLDSVTNLVNRLAKDRARPADDAPTRAASLAILVAELSRQVQAGLPFAETLSLIRLLHGTSLQANALPDQAIATLTPLAATGVPHRIALYLAFPAAAREAKANYMSEGQAGFWQSVMRLLSHLVVVRRIDRTTGESLDAILAAANNALTQDGLGSAVTLLQRLPASAAPAFADWLGQAQNILAAETAVTHLTRYTASLFNRPGTR